jgi:hypothetical protein
VERKWSLVEAVGRMSRLVVVEGRMSWSGGVERKWSLVEVEERRWASGGYRSEVEVGYRSEVEVGHR